MVRERVPLMSPEIDEAKKPRFRVHKLGHTYVVVMGGLFGRKKPPEDV